MHTLVREFEAAQVKQEKFDFRPGDTVRVSVRIVEGGKERIQDFQGVCIRRRGGGMNETFTVRRISYGVGMERVFPLHSPRIVGVRVVRRGKVRRANLSYLRARRGKKARITEDLLRTRKEVLAAQQAAAEGADSTDDAAREAEVEAAPVAETEVAPEVAEPEAEVSSEEEAPASGEPEDSEPGGPRE